MKNTTKAIGVLSALALAIIIAGPTTFAYQGNPSTQGPNCTNEQHEAMTEVFNNNDYSSWKNIVEKQGNRGRKTQIINENNFQTFVKMRKLMLEGKTDEAIEIRKSLGLGLRNEQRRYGQSNKIGQHSGKQGFNKFSQAK